MFEKPWPERSTSIIINISNIKIIKYKTHISLHLSLRFFLCSCLKKIARRRIFIEFILICFGSLLFVLFCFLFLLFISCNNISFIIFKKFLFSSTCWLFPFLNVMHACKVAHNSQTPFISIADYCLFFLLISMSFSLFHSFAFHIFSASLCIATYFMNEK